jgi:acyl dehydratase
LPSDRRFQAQCSFAFPTGMTAPLPGAPAPQPAPLPAPLPALNGATLLRALVKRPRRPSGQPTPRTRYLLERIDTALLARYRAALGFDGGCGDAVPLTFWYLPAQRAQVATMLYESFPFRLAGAVHGANLLRSHGRPDLDAPLLLTTTATVQPPRENGAVLAVLDTIGEQHGRRLFDCRSTYLMVRGRAHGARPARAHEVLPAGGGWDIGPACGRRYAALSGDWNPIHLWPWSARLMGMRRPIIHGMHTLGRACAALERLHARPLALLDARFLAPLPLGSTVTLGATLDADAAGGRFSVERSHGAERRSAVSGRFALAGDALAPGFV